MYRGTTPRVEIECDFDVSTIEVLYITFVQNNETIIEKTFEDCEIEDSKIACDLTQNDTLKLKASKRDNGAKDWLEIQVTVKLKNGQRITSKIDKIEVEKVLKDGVI